MSSVPQIDHNDELDAFRLGLVRHCYRMLGSLSDAEDAVQTTYLRAWKNRDQFRGDSSPKTWIYRIATNVCLDHLKHSDRRIRPMEEVTQGQLDSELRKKDPALFLEPFPTSPARFEDVSPQQALEERELLTLAVVGALQNLSPKQRAALLLTEVTGMSAREVAQCLECTTGAVTSALQRARAVVDRETMAPSSPTESELEYAARFVSALEAYDMDAIAKLMHDDVILSMPPYELWLQGVSNLIAWFSGRGIGCAGSRFIPTHANGDVAFAQYRAAPSGGHVAWAMIVLERENGLITGYNAFLETERLFPRFGLPLELPAD